MNFQSRNMSYAFYHEYYDDLPSDFAKLSEHDVQGKTSALCNFSFPECSGMAEAFREIPGFRSFTLSTTYPGLTMGLGYTHDLAAKGAIKQGFSFDYTSGLPYIPGSTLKGCLRSCFPGTAKPTDDTAEGNKAAYLHGLLKAAGVDVSGLFDIPKGPKDTVPPLEKALFEQGIVFLGAYPRNRAKQALINLDYVTPHKKITANPIPIPFLKVRPDVPFEFCFAMAEQIAVGEQEITAETICRLFKTLILDMGIGAKTSVGFGRFSETPASAMQSEESSPVREEAMDNGKEPPKDGEMPEIGTVIEDVVSGRSKKKPRIAFISRKKANGKNISFCDDKALSIGTKVKLELIEVNGDREKWICIDPKLPKRR